MKLYLLIITLLITPIKANNLSISEEAEQILQTHFHNDRTFKKYVRSILRKEITDPSAQNKLMNAVVLYRFDIHSANDLSQLFDILSKRYKAGNFDIFTSHVHTIRDAYNDEKGQLNGREMLKILTYLSVLQEKSFLEAATKAVIQLASFPDFKKTPTYSRSYLADNFLKPLSEKRCWDDNLTTVMITNLTKDKKSFEESGQHISIMNIGFLYVRVKSSIERL